MLSVLRPNSPFSEPKAVKFKSVLGLGGTQKGAAPVTNQYRPPVTNLERQRSYSRRSVDTVSSYRAKRRSRTDRSSTSDVACFEDDAVTILKSSDIPHDMPVKNTTGPVSMSSRRGPFRVADQEGPWAISVAETPHDTSSYSLYVKSECFSPCLYYVRLWGPCGACLRRSTVYLLLRILLQGY